ncbi:hypothetical protein KCP69_21130 [Salmonella enterica subsp. enterica]|nr:hypothetical protein KCP69_21130 [Salmonella enterica subsp. enterica]
MPRFQPCNPPRRHLTLPRFNRLRLLMQPFIARKRSVLGRPGELVREQNECSRVRLFFTSDFGDLVSISRLCPDDARHHTSAKVTPTPARVIAHRR